MISANTSLTLYSTSDRRKSEVIAFRVQSYELWVMGFEFEIWV
jgi:hypothetical protein